MKSKRRSKPQALRYGDVRPTPMPSAPPQVESGYVYAPIHHGDGAGDAGQILEGRFTVEGDTVYVADTEGRSIGSQALQPGDDPARVARAILRKGAPNEFWRDLPIARVPI
jgi:hypothetical protein